VSTACAGRWRRRRRWRIADTEQPLTTAREDTAALDAAQQRLAEVTADPGMLAAIAAAKQAVDKHALTAAPQRKELPSAG
jgi:hypothetical protein